MSGARRDVARWVLGAALVLLLAAPAIAHADPCKAIPDHGRAPAYLSRGSAFSGAVVYVGDGDSLCVAMGESPETWFEVRLQDFYAPELHDPAGATAKATLNRLAIGKRATCRVDH